MNDEPKTPPRTGQGMDYGEQADVQQVHAAVQREKREPRVGAEPLSIWLIAIYGLAIFFGGAYLGRYSGNFISGGLDPMGAPPAPKKAVGRRSRRRRASRTIAARSRQKSFCCKLSDVPSSEWSRRAWPISAPGRFRIYELAARDEWP